MKRTIERVRLQQDPYLRWNTFIDLVALEEYGDLTGVPRLSETVAALRDLGLPCQAQVLSRAVTAFAAAPPGSAWDDILEDHFIDELDADFHRCSPTVVEALERHLASHTDEYLEEA